jgi:MFS family permease
VAGVLGFTFANLLSAFAGSLPQLAITRFVAVCFEELVLIVAAVLVVEEVAAAHRGLATGALAVAAGLGAGASAIAYPVVAPHWRLLYVPGLLGLPAAWALWRWLPEGRVWSASRNRAQLSALLVSPWRVRAILLVGFSALGALFYEPAGLFAAFFGSRVVQLSPATISAVVIISGLVAAPAFVAGGWLTDRFGRRWPGVALSLLAALTGGLTFVGNQASYWLGSIAAGVFAGAFSPLVSAWMGELLPTRARATGESATDVAFAVGGIVGLQLLALLQPQWGLSRSLLSISASAVAGSLLLLFLPETRGAALPE